MWSRVKLTRSAGDEVLPLISRAEEELKVYSPFISPRYAKTLVKKAENGTDVEVFTATPDPDGGHHRRSLQILRGGPKHPKTERDAGLTLIILGAVTALLASLEFLALIPSALFFLGGGYFLREHFRSADKWSEKHGEVDINILENLHAKLYSRDGGEETIFGSANLTNSGMSHNLEVIGRENQDG